MACKFVVSLMDRVAPPSTDKIQRELVACEQARAQRNAENRRLLALARWHKSDYYAREWVKGVEDHDFLTDRAQRLHRSLKIRHWYNGMRKWLSP
jgi:hypothetical protein